MRIRVYWFCTLLIPFIASLPLVAMGYILYYAVYPGFAAVVGPEIAIISLIAGPILLLGMVLYILLTGLLGWWSNYDLFIFWKAAALSGPSKFIFNFLYRIVRGGSSLAKKVGTHGKHVIPCETAFKQIEELLEKKKKTEQARKVEQKEKVEEAT